jgi:hypothetical protein
VLFDATTIARQAENNLAIALDSEQMTLALDLRRRRLSRAHDTRLEWRRWSEQFAVVGHVTIVELMFVDVNRIVDNLWISDFVN